MSGSVTRKWVRQLQQNGYSTRELAASIGVAPSTLERFMKKGQTRAPTRQKLTIWLLKVKKGRSNLRHTQALDLIVAGRSPAVTPKKKQQQAGAKEPIAGMQSAAAGVKANVTVPWPTATKVNQSATVKSGTTGAQSAAAKSSAGPGQPATAKPNPAMVRTAADHVPPPHFARSVHPLMPPISPTMPSRALYLDESFPSPDLIFIGVIDVAANETFAALNRLLYAGRWNEHEERKVRKDTPTVLSQVVPALRKDAVVPQVAVYAVNRLHVREWAPRVYPTLEVIFDWVLKYPTVGRFEVVIDERGSDWSPELVTRMLQAVQAAVLSETGRVIALTIRIVDSQRSLGIQASDLTAYIATRTPLPQLTTWGVTLASHENVLRNPAVLRLYNRYRMS